ncbi:hypothetical protein [Corticibacter populi]|nr:hypothetical protein [Corticibacter populi]RZS31681.1 hypothetical protein EV687_2350 [Corticibacter populi]
MKALALETLAALLISLPCAAVLAAWAADDQPAPLLAPQPAEADAGGPQ